MKTDKQDLKECIETLNTLVEKLNQHSSVLNEIENIYQKLSVHFDYEQPVIQQEELSAPCLTRRQTRIEKKASLRMSNHFTLEALVHAKIIDQIELDMQKPVTDELAIELDSIKPISTEMNERGDCLKITGSNLHLDINPTPTTIVHENSVKSVKVTEEIVSPEAATASPEVKTVPPEVKAVPPEIKEITLEVIDTKESSNIQTEINIPTENPVKNSVPTYINLENARNSRIRKSSYSPGISSSNDYERFKLKMNPEKNAFFESNSSIKSDNKNVPACASVRLKPIEPVSSTVEIAKVPSQKNSNLSWLNMYFLSAAYSDFGSSLSKNDRDFSLNLTSEGKLGNGINRLSHFIAFWDFFLSLLYIVSIAIIPIIASFSSMGHEFIGFCYFLTAVYFLDVIVNLFTIREKNIVVTVYESRIIYLKSRFVFDVISMIPWFAIFSNEGYSLFYMIRTYNLYKISTDNAIYKKIANTMDEKYGLGSSFFSMFGMGSLLFVFLHFHACLYFLVGKQIGFSSTSWITLNNNTGILQKPLIDQYSWAFFAAISNTFPVTGYRPSSVVEKWITIFLILIGATLYAVLVGTISSFSFGLDSSGRLYNEKIEEVQEYLNFKQLDDKIKTRVKKYYELKYNGKYFDEKQIMSELNISLRQEIAVHLCKNLVEKVPFLNRKIGDGRDESFVRSISTALEPVYYIDGDHIFEQGEIGNEMYFVYSGVLDVEVNGKVVTQLKEGAFFGEVALLGQVPRTASITARRNTCLYSLDRETLEDILIDYEDVSQKMQKIYEERVQKALSENESRTEEQKKQLSIRKIQSRLNSEREKRKSGGSFENTRKSGSSFDKGTSSRRQSESLASSIPADFFADRQKVNPIVTTENITAKLDLALDDVIE